MALITCQEVSFGYEGTPVIEGLNFSVNAGDYLCIVGENGSGKSTLLKGLLRLISPQQGNIVMSDGLHANEIGYLPQQTTVQKNFPASVYEIVLSGFLSQHGIRPFYTKQDKANALENLNQLGIFELRNRCFRELSGGQQRRVLLARALCATQKALLLDEPAAGLDPAATKELYRIIAQLSSRGVAIIMISHDIHSAVECASHILHLQNKQAFFGTAEEYAKTQLGAYFLGGQKHD